MSDQQKAPQYNIAVTGAGIAGLAVASFLKGAGHNVTLFERAQAVRPVGAGLLLQPTGLACLAELGLRDDVIAKGAKIDRLHGVTHKGKTVFDLRHASMAEGLYSLGIHRGSLFGALLGKAQKLGVSFVTGFDAAQAVQDGKSIRLQSTDGALTEVFDLAVDASGLHSKLRNAHAAGARVTPYPYASLWTICRDSEAAFTSSTLAQRYIGSRKMSGVLPVGEDPARPGEKNAVAFFWSLKADEATWRGQDFAAWKQEVKALWPETSNLLAQMEKPEGLTFSTYSDTVLKRSAQGRLVFIGDAAHSTSPQLGQGGNLALMDALCLSRCLNEHGSPEAALAAYDKTRKGPHNFYRRASRWLTPFFQSDSSMNGMLRDNFMPRAMRVPLIEKQAVLSLTGLKTGMFTHMKPASFLPPN